MYNFYCGFKNKLGLPLSFLIDRNGNTSLLYNFILYANISKIDVLMQTTFESSTQQKLRFDWSLFCHQVLYQSDVMSLLSAVDAFTWKLWSIITPNIKQLTPKTNFTKWRKGETGERERKW